MRNGGTTAPWRHSDIKEALIAETYSKCAYCEAMFMAVSYGDIEHILPKSIFPELVVDWANLTLVCSRCNNEKGAKYEEEVKFVNPYVDRIEDHLLYLGSIAHPVSDRGLYTVRELDLNSPSRVEARDRELNSLESLFRRIEESSSEYIRSTLQKLICLQIENGPFTASTRSYVALRKRATV